MKRLAFVVSAVAWTGCGNHPQSPPHEYSDCIAESNPVPARVSSGCGSIFVYQMLDPSRAVTVSVRVAALRPTTSCSTVSLSPANPDVHVELQVAGGDPDRVYFDFCNDVAVPNRAQPRLWSAMQGTLSVVACKNDPAFMEVYRVTLKLSNVRFRDPVTQEEVFFPEIVFWDVGVGGLPG